MRDKYGWVICAVATLVLFCNTGLTTTGFTAYQPFLISIAGLTDLQSSQVIMCRTLFTIVGILCARVLIYKIEIRRLVTGAVLLCALTFVLFAAASNFTGFCIAGSLAGFVVGAGGISPVSTLLSRWFNTHRGFAMGFAMASTGLSTMIASPFITWAISSHSIRFSFLCEAGFVFLTAILAYVFLRSNPSCLHTHPIGSETVDTAGTYAPADAPRGLYVVMLLGVFLFGAPGNTLYAYLSVLYRSVGFTAADISRMLSIFGIALMIGKCSYGLIADRIGAYASSWLFYASAVLGTGLCCLAGNLRMGTAMAAVICSGFGYAVTTVSISMYASGIATEKNYGKVVTNLQLVSMVGSLAFSTVPGMLAQRYGNYVQAFVLMFVLALVCSIVPQVTFHIIQKQNRRLVTPHREI